MLIWILIRLYLSTLFNFKFDFDFSRWAILIVIVSSRSGINREEIDPMNCHFIELKPCEASSQALSPINFLERTGNLYGERTSVVYGSVRFTWAQTIERCRMLASVIRSLNIKTWEVVSCKWFYGLKTIIFENLLV